MAELVEFLLQEAVFPRLEGGLFQFLILILVKLAQLAVALLLFPQAGQGFEALFELAVEGGETAAEGFILGIFVQQAQLIGSGEQLLLVALVVKVDDQGLEFPHQ